MARNKILTTLDTSFTYIPQSYSKVLELRINANKALSLQKNTAIVNIAAKKSTPFIRWKSSTHEVFSIVAKYDEPRPAKIDNTKGTALTALINDVVSTLPLTKDAYSPILLILIEQCNNPNTLNALHKHFSAAEYNFLRARTGVFSVTRWQGTDEKGHVVSTSKTWADIEKKIALQIMSCHSPLKTEHVAESYQKNQARAAKLANKYPFFAIPRNRMDSMDRNGSYYAFAAGNSEKVEEKKIRCFA
ncbi:hypothetical protein BH10PSE19_BH10PSE19_07300 [soil metagenome]